MNHVLQQPNTSSRVLRQTLPVASLNTPLNGELIEKRVRYLMALGLSKNVARVMAAPNTKRETTA